MLKTVNYLITILLLFFTSCKNSSTKTKIDSSAIQLQNQALKLVPFIENVDSAKKAIVLLDQATLIDTNYFLGFQNKIMFYKTLNQYDKIIQTINKLIQLRPNENDLYLTGGMIYEKIGDTINSNKYFLKSLAICNSVLDTMNKKNPDYLMIVMNKAINLKMLNEEESAKKIILDLENNEAFKNKSEYFDLNDFKSLIDKSKKELISNY